MKKLPRKRTPTFSPREGGRGCSADESLKDYDPLRPEVRAESYAATPRSSWLKPVKYRMLAPLLLLPLLAHAEWGQFDIEFENEKPWVELATQLPPYPKAENLIPFNVSSATRNRYFIDAASISVGEDKIVRYTVVVEAAGGAKNVSFEGLRCESGERRIYAYGHPDNTWSKARNAAWEDIKFRSLLSYQKALFEDHFCQDGSRVKDGAEAVENLRRAAR